MPLGASGVSARFTVADLAASGVLNVGRNRQRLAEAAGLPFHETTTDRPAQASTAAHPKARVLPGAVAGAQTPPSLACLEFTVPTAPRGWEKPKPVGYGRTIKGQDERSWQSDIARYARQAKAAAGATGLIRGGVRLSVIAYLEVPKSYRAARRADCLAGRILPAVKPDWDRIENSIGDALTGVLWVDDKQVVHGSCLKVWAEIGSLYVRVQAL